MKNRWQPFTDAELLAIDRALDEFADSETETVIELRDELERVLNGRGFVDLSKGDS